MAKAVTVNGVWSVRCSNCNFDIRSHRNQKPQTVVCPNCGTKTKVEED